MSLMSVKDVAENVNKYCQCDGTECTCCRAFHLIDINILKNEGNVYKNILNIYFWN